MGAPANRGPGVDELGQRIHSVLVHVVGSHQKLEVLFHLALKGPHVNGQGGDAEPAGHQAAGIVCDHDTSARLSMVSFAGGMLSDPVELFDFTDGIISYAVSH